MALRVRVRNRSEDRRTLPVACLAGNEQIIRISGFAIYIFREMPLIFRMPSGENPSR